MTETERERLYRIMNDARNKAHDALDSSGESSMRYQMAKRVLDAAWTALLNAPEDSAADLEILRKREEELAEKYRKESEQFEAFFQ